MLTSMHQARTIYADGARRIIDLGEPIPDAYFATGMHVELVSSREEALERIRRLAPSRVAIVESDRGSASSSNSESVDVTITPSGAYELTNTSPGWLVINGTYDAGWTATVNGTPSPVVRANGLVRAVQIPAGTHTVTLRYAPLDGIVTRWLWAIGLLVSLMLLALPMRPTRDALKTP